MPYRTSAFPQHFNGKRYYNPDGRQAPGLLEVIKWKLRNHAEKSSMFVNDVEPSSPGSVDPQALRATFVNHSTVLIQHSGLNILTDPIWSHRASPFRWIGPQRRRLPGISWEGLPHIHFVLISHNHYDHLDLPTLRRLSFGSGATFIVPAGVAQLLRSKGIDPAHELDWDESWSSPQLTVDCVPALHFSSRGLFDRNLSLWCGYVIRFAERLIFFAGDTSFGDHFAQIREKFGEPDLALLPIGAYQPRSLMWRVHMSPEEAIRAHEILGAKTSVAIHHGTFQLTDEGIDTPGRELMAGSPPPSFLVLKNGQQVDIP